MVLSMADFGKSWKSLQTLWNACKTVLKWFVIGSANVCIDLGWIRKRWKIGRFWAKTLGYSPWFEHGRFWQVLEIAPNSLERLQNRSKMIFECLRGTVCVDLGWIRKGRKLADFEQKAWAIAHGFEHGRFWQVLEIAPNSLETPAKTVLKWFVSACANVCIDLGWIRKRSKIGRFEQKAWAIAHGLKMADFGKSWKSLQTLWNACKTVLKWFVTACATVCLDLGAWAIAHGFEHGHILASPRYRSTLSETPAKPF